MLHLHFTNTTRHTWCHLDFRYVSFIFAKQLLTITLPAIGKQGTSDSLHEQTIASTKIWIHVWNMIYRDKTKVQVLASAFYKYAGAKHQNSWFKNLTQVHR